MLINAGAASNAIGGSNTNGAIGVNLRSNANRAFEANGGANTNKRLMPLGVPLPIREPTSMGKSISTEAINQPGESNQPGEPTVDWKTGGMKLMGNVMLGGMKPIRDLIQTGGEILMGGMKP